MSSRRSFIKTTISGMAGLGIHGCAEFPKTPNRDTTYQILDQVLDQPVFKRELFPEAIRITHLELLEKDGNFICRVRDSTGAEGFSVSNNMQMVSLYPIFLKRLQPFFIGKDARDLETLIEEVYVHKSNYKLQSLALWVPLATIEFALLDLLGRIANKSIGQLIGRVQNTAIAVYRANNFRGKSAEESLEGIIKNVEESGARAIKFKIGGRMSRNRDYPTGRSEKLIPLVRKHFGPDMTLYADSNGSYDTQKAIQIGRLLEEHRIDFYEEPVPFDWYEETQEVAAALQIPIAGGEQESSLHQFRWLIANQALQIVQPDLFYFGGMIRSMKVAQMAHAMGKICIPHISGSGLGYLYMMHFVSALPNAGPYHEFKGFNEAIPFTCDSCDFKITDGRIQVPKGPGMGLELDKKFIEAHKVLY